TAAAEASATTAPAIRMTVRRALSRNARATGVKGRSVMALVEIHGRAALHVGHDGLQILGPHADAAGEHVRRVGERAGGGHGIEHGAAVQYDSHRSQCARYVPVLRHRQLSLAIHPVRNFPHIPRAQYGLHGARAARNGEVDGVGRDADPSPRTDLHRTAPQQRAAAFEVNASAVHVHADVDAAVRERLTPDLLFLGLALPGARVENRVSALLLELIHAGAQPRDLLLVARLSREQPRVRTQRREYHEQRGGDESAMAAAVFSERHCCEIVSTSSSGTPDGSLRPKRTRAVISMDASGSMRRA